MENNNSVLLEMKNICKSFPGVKALDNVSLTVKRGTVHALMGENGAGKSTLMKLLVAALMPTEGSILVDGAPLNKVEGKLKASLGYLPQDFGLFDELTVTQFLDYMAALKGLRSPQAAIRDVIRAVNLEEKAGRLYFCLYRFHEWPDYTLFWIPIDFIEKISVPVRCIVREFIRRFIRHHGLNMVKETWYYELALEELRDWKNRDPDASPQEVRRNSLLAESYDNGKISKALKRMEGKPFCVRLEDKIRECRTEAKRERDLLGLVSEGLELITPDSPCLIQYYYDWAYEKEPDFPPIGLDTQIMLAYSNNDMLAENMESYFNSDCRETYTITPVTYMYLTPETDRLFRMDDYPERLSKWMQRFMQHIAGSF